MRNPHRAPRRAAFRPELQEQRGGAAYVAEQRKQDAQMVADAEELLKLEQMPPASGPPSKLRRLRLSANPQAAGTSKENGDVALDDTLTVCDWLAAGRARPARRAACAALRCGRRRRSVRRRPWRPRASSSSAPPRIPMHRLPALPICVITDVLRSDPFLRDKKVIQVSRWLPVRSQEPAALSWSSATSSRTSSIPSAAFPSRAPARSNTPPS